MRRRTAAVLSLFALAIVLAPVAADAQDIPRTASGRPDLSGSYDTATLTPLQRPERYGDQLVLSDEEAADYVARGPEELPSGIEQWVNAIEDGTEMSITIQDGRNLTELLQAAYRSSAQGRAVTLPL